MKYYFEQKRDKILCEKRLHTLNKKLEIVEKQINNCTSEMKELSISSSNFSNDKYDNYLIQKEDIRREIALKYDELKVINEDLEEMQKAIESFSGVEGRIFKLIEKDKLSTTQITARTGYSKATVYRYLEKINEKLRSEKKWDFLYSKMLSWKNK